MRSRGHVPQFGHPCHTDRANESAVIKQIGLNDVCHAVSNRVLKAPMTGLLFSECDRYLQGIFDFFCRIEIIEWTRLLKKGCADALQHPTHFDGMRWVVRAVRIRVNYHLVSEF